MWSSRASGDGAPPWAGATWTARLRSAVSEIRRQKSQIQLLQCSESPLEDLLAWSPRRVPAPGEGAGSLLRPPSGRRSLPVGLSSGACSTRGRVLDRALPEITDSRSRPLPVGSHQHPRRWLPLSDAPCRLQRVRRARARSKLRHWANARHRLISNCSSVKLENNTQGTHRALPLEHHGTQAGTADCAPHTHAVGR